MSEPIGSSAACGCRVAIEDDVMHVYPCSPDHEPALTAASRDMAISLGVPFEELE